MDDEIRLFVVTALKDMNKFNDGDAGQLALMTLGEFTAEVAGRAAVAAGNAGE